MKRRRANSVKKSKINNPPKKIAFAKSVDTFVSSVDNLETAFSAVFSFVKNNSVLKDRTFGKYVSMVKRKKANVTLAEYQNLQKVSVNTRKAHIATHIIPESLFISSIAQFDCLIKDLLGNALTSQPGLLNTLDNKSIEISEVLKAGKIENLKKDIIDAETDSVLRKSHTDQFKWFENRLKISLTSDEGLWAKFIEITERRNLLVHTDGVISRQYIENCKKNKVLLPPTVKIGDTLGISEKYFIHSINTLLEIGIKLTHVIWRKVLPSDISVADDDLNDFIFKCLTLEKYKLAEKIGDFALSTLPKLSSEMTKRIFVINKAIALKYDNRNDAAIKLLSEFDWSASDNTLKLAVATIKEDRTDIIKQMKAIGADNAMKMFYHMWPLFKQIRNKDYFLKTYKSIYRKNFTAYDQTTMAEHFKEMHPGVHHQI